MPKSALYSRSKPQQQPGTEGESAVDSAAPTLPARKRFAALRRLSPSDPRLLWSAIALLAALLAANAAMMMRPGPPKLTQAIIDSAVLKTLETADLPSPAAKAYEAILPSVVQVLGFVKSKDGKEDIQNGVGTGVVIVDKGIILTNLHVVQGAQSIKVIFSDGLESTASVTGTKPESDLAVLQAHKIPDDMIAATMRSTSDLRPGDQVLAVGFPFGIGPSASAGVISGLKRSFRSPEGKNELNNLIQFDAAANPGNSGGPLVTMDGQVVGIVTAILNPTPHRTFLGIGFAVPIEDASSAAGLPPF
jgi:S1-C subfamily serine protease